MRLLLTMETMHAAGRRTLPPVPRSSPEPAAAVPGPPASGPSESAHDPSESTTERFVVDLPTGEQHRVSGTETDPSQDVPPAPAAETAAPAAEDAAPGADNAVPGTPEGDAPREAPAGAAAELDAAQDFVVRLRATAADFAEAAGAVSAVVREAVPPARHRRARCRVVLRYPDEREVDVTFLGAAGIPGTPSRHGFDRQIRRWLAAGQRRDDAWLVADPDAPDGLAVDLSAWAGAA